MRVRPKHSSFFSGLAMIKSASAALAGHMCFSPKVLGQLYCRLNVAPILAIQLLSSAKHIRLCLIRICPLDRVAFIGRLSPSFWVLSIYHSRYLSTMLSGQEHELWLAAMPRRSSSQIATLQGPYNYFQRALCITGTTNLPRSGHDLC
jgi:hypothetical protein